MKLPALSLNHLVLMDTAALFGLGLTTAQIAALDAAWLAKQAAAAPNEVERQRLAAQAAAAAERAGGATLAEVAAVLGYVPEGGPQA